MAMFKATAEITIYVEKYVNADNIVEAEQILEEEYGDDILIYKGETIIAKDDITITGSDDYGIAWDVEYDEEADRH